MAHLRCPTFNSLNGRMSSLNRLTLASHNNFSRSPTLSPIRPSYPSLVPFNTRILAEADDFQSNAQCSFSRSNSYSTGLGLCYPQPLKDHTKAASQNLKTTLADAVYSFRPATPPKPELSEPISDLGELSCFCDTQIASQWSLSSLTSNSEPLDLTKQGGTPFSSRSNLVDDVTPETFKHLATSSGMSVDSLADHLAATADLALQFLANNPGYTSHSHSSISSSSLLEEGNPSWSSMESYTVPWPEEQIIGVDPSEIAPRRFFECVSPRLPGGSSPILPFDDLVKTQLNKATLEGNHDGLSNLNGADAHEPLGRTTKSAIDSDFMLSDSEYDDRSSSTFPSPYKKPRMKRAYGSAKRPEAATKKFATFKPFKPKQKQRIEIITEAMTPVHPPEASLSRIDLGTPVLDAYRGIRLDELSAKAQRYRLRNPGRIYDNDWLSSFAGKLSDNGELLNDYRCYIDGCTQVNKRRDHILIHIGSHLDQRPFPCAYCPARFLRKNECKRHEASHSGVKPFVCHICSNTAFVRQDLLKRHTARAHGMKPIRKRKGGEDKENKTPDRSSKKVKLEPDL
ncbi:hypothetical protein H0H93_008394 [Arthromyces matolae]|nr:hypothetical protein H0H93_008394 [Arthromyces matolae]